MSDPITPALTAEEWRTGVDIAYGLWWATLEDAASREAYEAGTGEVEATNQAAPWLMLSGKSTHPNGIVFRRHALAALALHGQPFGFTREDVAALMYAVNDLRDAAPDVDDSDAMLAAANTLHSLANRIHALLPPEPTK